MDMEKLTQKYTIVHLINDLPDGYKYSMFNWPLHVTLADVFSIERDPADLLVELDKMLSSNLPIQSKVMGEEWFGEDKSVHVLLLNKTEELQKLHDSILRVLERYGVKFNSPQYTKEGFKPHSTVQKNEQLQLHESVTFDSVTLIDMFPEEDPLQRRVLGTIHFQKL